MSTNTLDIVALSGSLRSGSFNARLLEIAKDLAPADAEIDIYDYSDVPLYNGDHDDAGAPAAVQHLRERIRRADAVLIATPEYNFSVPGVLKNALDWASRPYGQSAVAGKPLAIIGGGGGQGTNRAQDHLRQIAHGLDMRPVARPEVFVANVWSKLAEADGFDPMAKKLIAELLENLAQLARGDRAQAQAAA
jgi:chromate reductase